MAEGDAAEPSDRVCDELSDLRCGSNHGLFSIDKVPRSANNLSPWVNILSHFLGALFLVL